jgi:hypothetical protein
MHTMTPVPTKGQIRSMVPQTAAKYGVIFGPWRQLTTMEVEMQALQQQEAEDAGRGRPPGAPVRGSLSATWRSAVT